jgi:REP element-mobilizing transposase RayT
MVRPLRIQYRGAFYHVTSRGNEKKDLYRDDCDRRRFLKILKSVVDKYKWNIYAYCLMNNHYHLLIETPLKNLSFGMRQLNGVYGQYFNRRHTRVGHLFQGRFKSLLIEKESYLLEVSRYIILNPVRAGLIDEPVDWKWSSYRGMVAFRKKSFLQSNIILGFFSNYLPEAQKKYIEYINEGIGRESPLKKAKGGFILGGNIFVAQSMKKVERIRSEEIRKQEKYVSRPKLNEIFYEVNRDEGINIAINKWGYSLKAVGDFLDLHYSWISRIANGKAKNKT